MTEVYRSETAREFGALWTHGVIEVLKAQENLLRAQGDLSNALQETIQQWPDRIQSRANLASEFASKLIASRSMFDVVAASQLWTCHRFAMMADEVWHLLTEGMKLSEIGSRVPSNVSLPEGPLDSSGDGFQDKTDTRTDFDPAPSSNS